MSDEDGLNADSVRAKVRRAATDPAILAANLGLILTSPLRGLQKAVQHLRGKRRLHVEWKTYTVPPVTPDRVVANIERRSVHIAILGPTIGEFRLMDLLAQRLRAERPEIAITYCLKDPNSLAKLIERHPASAFAFSPHGFLPSVLRWLSQVQPDIVIFAESNYELVAWPAKKFGARVVLFNGRSRRRPRAKNTWRAPLLQWKFRPYDALLLQSEAYAANAREWAEPTTEIVNTGDLKAELSAAATAPPDVEGLRAWLDDAGSPLFIAGSTADLEEDAMVLAAFLDVKKETPCRLLIAPRSIARANEIRAYVENQGLTVSQRSLPSPGAEVLILDTLGELAWAYQFGVAAYVGGSYGKFGKGHNVMEPVQWERGVAYGMQRGNFDSLQRLCEAAGVGFRIDGPEALAAFWRRVLTHPNERDSIAEKARALMATQAGGLDLAVSVITRLIDEVQASRNRHNTESDE